jgi:hypothetical protein
MTDDRQSGETQVEELKRLVRFLEEAPATEDRARRLQQARRALASARTGLDDTLRDRHDTARRTGLRP